MNFTLVEFLAFSQKDSLLCPSHCSSALGTYLRERLDEVDPETLRQVFRCLFSQLQRSKGLENIIYWESLLQEARE